MRLFAPFGFYGFGNIGDEATMAGFAALIRRWDASTHVSLASMNPRHTSRISPGLSHVRTSGFDLRRGLAEKRADAVVFAGGTPVMDCLGDWPLSQVIPLVENARTRGRPIAFVGVGTETLSREQSRAAIRQRVAPHVRHWTVRSTNDRLRLLEYGVDASAITIAGDMAWLLEPVAAAEGQAILREAGINPSRKLIGVNAMAETAALAKEPALFEKLALCLDALIQKHDAEVLFLANEIRPDDSFDQAAHRQIRLRMRRTSRTFACPARYWTPTQMMSLIACCSLTITMRYHFCLFSALQGIPFVALERSDKVADLCRDLNWPVRVALAGMDNSAVIEHCTRLEHNRERLLAELAQARAAMAKRAGANTAALDALLPETLPHPTLQEVSA